MTAMRKTGFLFGIALLLITGSLAGCFGKDDESGATTPTPTPDDPGAGDDGTGAGDDGTGDDGTGDDGTGDDGTGDDGTGDGGNATTEPPKPDPVNETFSITVSGGITQVTGASGSSTLSVANGQWMAFDVTCTVRGSGPNGEYLTDGGTFEAAFGEEVVASTQLPAAPGPGEVTLSIPSGEAGDYVFTAAATEGTTGWTLDCIASITY